MTEQLAQLAAQTKAAVTELVAAAGLTAGTLLVIGCSTSEIAGGVIGHASAPEIGEVVARAALDTLEGTGIALAAQCCEHLNRALIVERETAQRRGYEIVSVVPFPKAGGSFATAVFHAMHDPVAVEEIRADAGLDIGGTLIGMHLRHVAVPVRLSCAKIGEAGLLSARTRPKYIGGARAHYTE